jgi:AmmeMemoRadiSam system protein A
VDPELNQAHRLALGGLALAAIEAHLRGEPSPELPGTRPFDLRRGAFVSVHVHGALRGCLGRVPADRPLGEVVRNLAVAAASEDPRFPPMSLRELPHVRIEISVLSTPVRLHPVDPISIVIGRDGVIVRRSQTASVLLPQVAVERGWSPEQFLGAACAKAGLPALAWREPATEVMTFYADVFGAGS